MTTRNTSTNEIDLMNLEKYKQDSEELKKLRIDLKRMLKFFSTETLILELKKRKFGNSKINWKTVLEYFEDQGQ